MSILLVLVIVAVGAWALWDLLSRGSSADPSASVRGFSQALHALERAPRRRATPRRFGPQGGRRP